MQINNTFEAMDYLVNLGVDKFKKEYPHVTRYNILEDIMLAQFFKQSLLLTKTNLPNAKQVQNAANTKAMTYYNNGITILVAKIDKNLNLIENDKR